MAHRAVVDGKCHVQWLTSIPGVPRKQLKDHIVSNFANLDGKLRVVIANIAFGMGIDCTNIMSIVHWGPSETVEDYVHEVGRAGRDGQPTCALLFHTPRDKGHMWERTCSSIAQYM